MTDASGNSRYVVPRAGLEPRYESSAPRGSGGGYLLRFAMVSSLARELRVVPNSKL